MIGSLTRRVIEVVRPRIKRKLLDKLWVEPGLPTNLWIDLIQNLERALDQLVISAGRDAHIFDVQRYWPHPFVSIRFQMSIGFQDSDRPIPGVIIEDVDRVLDDALRFIPGSTLRQN